MKKNRARAGFTLIELMIVIAIIAIIAAIAIPGLIQSQRASNERNASASLKTLATAQADFRGNDRDGNKIQDFWTRDVAGLFAALPVGSTEMIKLIEVSVAGADFYWRGAESIGDSGLGEVALSAFAISAPKAGYWYKAMTQDSSGATTLSYAVDTNGIESVAGASSDKPWFHSAKFAFYAFPDTFTSGRNVFFINENNTIFKRSMNGSVKTSSEVPPMDVSLTVGGSGLIGSQVAEDWPTESVMRMLYGKLD